MAMTDAFLYALGVSLCSFCASFFNVPFAFLRQRYGMKLRIACTSLVYRKVRLHDALCFLFKTTWLKTFVNRSDNLYSSVCNSIPGLPIFPAFTCFVYNSCKLAAWAESILLLI